MLKSFQCICDLQTWLLKLGTVFMYTVCCHLTSLKVWKISLETTKNRQPSGDWKVHVSFFTWLLIYMKFIKTRRPKCLSIYVILTWFDYLADISCAGCICVSLMWTNLVQTVVLYFSSGFGKKHLMCTCQ